MFRFSLPERIPLALFLCLWAADAPAQEPEMVAPPLPDFSASAPPPDPAALPPPPSLEWEPLTPQDSAEELSLPALAVSVPPPEAEPSIAPPPPPVVETPLPGGPDPAEMELATPEVEIWREQSESPQIPPRFFNQLEPGYVTGTNPVILRVQFDPLAAGKSVYIKPGKGITLAPPVVVMTVSQGGECIVSAQLGESLAQSHIIFYCEGVKTVLPVVRASLTKVQEMEAESGGGE